MAITPGFGSNPTYYVPLSEDSGDVKPQIFSTASKTGNPIS
jgi:hypothetical protein